MKIRFCFFSFVTIGLFLNNYSFGQINASDTTHFKNALNKLTDKYINSVDDDKQILNGKEYLNYDKYYLTGHQFFKSGDEQEGDVFYDGYLFTKIPFLYDVMLDQIVISEPVGELQFKLESKRVSYFKIHDHLFIKLVTDSLRSLPIKPGFYDLLVMGKTQVLAKRHKRIFEDATPRGMEGSFLIEDKFYIHKNNQYYSVGKKKSIIKLFKESKKELLHYSRNQHLKFDKTNREVALIKLIEYYNTLP